MAVKSKGRNINPKAKKWKALRKKQALTNRYIREARQRLGRDNRYYISTMNKVHMFQKTHRQSRRQYISMEALRTGDIEAYENLLDSILENTYINPEKYEKHKSAQIERAIEEGWAENEEEAELVYEMRNSDLFEELEDIIGENMASEVLDKYAEYVQEELSMDDFYTMLKTYKKGYSNDSETSASFFDYADRFISLMQERDDITKAAEEYLKDESGLSFEDFLEQF